MAAGERERRTASGSPRSTARLSATAAAVSVPSRGSAATSSAPAAAPDPLSQTAWSVTFL